MPNIQSAKKRARQTIRRTERNSQVRTQVSSAVRKAREAIQSKDKNAQDIVRQAISTISKAGKRGVVHSRNAARKISRLMLAANAAK